ncbi:hypothetical protein ACET3Z_012245 [Daucus carota]
MGSNYCGEAERSGGSSSRKGKKNGSDKPKQPQRGLGVAQLEKIRLHSQMGRGAFVHPNSIQTPFPVTNYPIQEDVRLHTAYQSSSSSSYPTPSSTSYGFHGAQNMMIGLGDMERANIRYGDSQTATNIARWNGGNTVYDAQHYQQPSITRHLLNLESEEFRENKMKVRSSDSAGSGSQNSGSSGSQEIDLELRLSL